VARDRHAKKLDRQDSEASADAARQIDMNTHYGTVQLTGYVKWPVQKERNQTAIIKNYLA
jgi:hypothetical protein